MHKAEIWVLARKGYIQVKTEKKGTPLFHSFFDILYMQNLKDEAVPVTFFPASPPAALGGC